MSIPSAMLGPESNSDPLRAPPNMSRGGSRLGWPSLLSELGPGPPGAGAVRKGGHYRSQLRGGQELLELLELLLLLLQEMPLLLREAEAGGQDTDHGKGQGNTPLPPRPLPSSQTPSVPGGKRGLCGFRAGLWRHRASSETTRKETSSMEELSQKGNQDWGCKKETGFCPRRAHP
ncbi:unnamed protein product, partial [Gulo gulo]